MFEPTADIIKTVAVALGVILPALLGYAVYTREERKAAKAGHLPRNGLHAIGAGLLTESTAERAMNTLHEHKDSINRLARAVESYIEDRDRADEVDRRMADRMCDEMVAARRAIEEMKTAVARAAAEIETSARRRR